MSGNRKNQGEKPEPETPEKPDTPEPENPEKTGQETPEKPESPDYGELDSLAIDGDAPAPPKKPGAKSGPGDMGAGDLAALYEVVYAVAAARFGNHWKLQKKEAQALGEATDKVLEKYGAKTQFGPEMSLVMVVAVTTGPRVMMNAPAQGQGDGDKPADKAGEGSADGG